MCCWWYLTHVGIHGVEEVSEGLKLTVPSPNLVTRPLRTVLGGEGAQVSRQLNVCRCEAAHVEGGGVRGRMVRENGECMHIVYGMKE